MKTRWRALVTLIFVGCVIPSCEEAIVPERTEQLPPPSPQRKTPVHLAVGNVYNWRVTQLGFGTFSQWNERSEILRDTTLDSRRYYVFDTRQMLRSSGDTVSAHSPDSNFVFCRLNVSVGDVVPFMGYSFRVNAVERETVLGDTQTVITLGNGSAPLNIIESARYASKFGVIKLQRSDAQHVTTTSLSGARLGTTTYGSVF